MTRLMGILRDIGGKNPSLDGVIAVLADRQHGVVARWQLLSMGFGPDAIDHRIATARLHRVYQGVYAVGHNRLTLRGHFIAAVLACGPDAVLSHRSAARLWNLLPDSRRMIDVAVANEDRRSRANIKVHQTRSLHPDDVTLLDGIPVTSVARTLLDLAATEKRDRVERALEQAEKLRLVDGRAINQLLKRSPARRGRKLLNSLFIDAVTEPGTRQELERRFQRLIRDAGLPQPQVNVRVGNYEVDVLWEEQKLIVELDSREFHLTRSAFEADRERDAQLQVAGYRVIRITWRRLMNEPDAVVRDLRALLYAAARPMAEVSAVASASGARPLSM
jgi:very-short-patch-repair endonuclease